MFAKCMIMYSFVTQTFCNYNCSGNQSKLYLYELYALINLKQTVFAQLEHKAYLVLACPAE